MRPENVPFETHATLCVSNFGGYELQISDDGEWARAKAPWTKRPKWQEIKYDLSGRPYIRIFHFIHYLDEFVKVNLST